MIGYVVTDWGAQHAGIAGANAGLDVVMPRSSTWNSNLTDAIANGTMEASRLDDMITRYAIDTYLHLPHQKTNHTDSSQPGTS